MNRKTPTMNDQTLTQNPALNAAKLDIIALMELFYDRGGCRVSVTVYFPSICLLIGSENRKHYSGDCRDGDHQSWS